METLKIICTFQIGNETALIISGLIFLLSIIFCLPLILKTRIYRIGEVMVRLTYIFVKSPNRKPQIQSSD